MISEGYSKLIIIKYRAFTNGKENIKIPRRKWTKSTNEQMSKEEVTNEYKH